MESYWVYIVLCRDASYYIGITNNADLRVVQHNEGIDPHCYTFTRRPVRLVFATEFSSPLEAIRFEKQIKGWSRKKKEALIRGNWDEVVRISREIRHRSP